MTAPEAVAARVAVLGYEGVDELDLVGVFAPLAKAAACADHRPGLEVLLAGPYPLITGSNGLRLGAARRLGEAERCGVVVVPGGRGVQAAAGDPRLLTVLRNAHARGAAIFAVCSGAYLVAASGIGLSRAAIHGGKHALLRSVTSAEIGRGLIRDGGVTTIGGGRSASLKGTDIAFEILRRFAPRCLECVSGRMELAWLPAPDDRPAGDAPR